MILRVTKSLVVCLLLVQGFASEGKAQPAPPVEIPSIAVIPPAAQPSAHFDANAATEAYLAKMPAAARARSDAYFEGGYWLILWDLLYGAAISLVLLSLRWSARMRDVAERTSRFKPVQTLLYWMQYLAVTTLLGFPLAVYEGFFREHQYGLATQSFGPWLGDQLKALLVELILGGLVIALLFGVVRKFPATWHMLGAGVMILFIIFVSFIGPVFILPLFNKVTRLSDPKITAPILSMARANGIPAGDVFEVDASRQTTRMSANVSGFGNTMRITLNDNLLRRASLGEIQAVMGHEMGHYVLNHVYKGILFFTLLFVVGFGLLRWSLAFTLSRWGERWQIRGIGDTAVLPLVILLGSIFFFVLTPLLNTEIRTSEQEADIYGLNTSRQPDDFAQAALHLGEYRKMSPGPLEEWIFFDHPSGRTRIHNAMRWKGENLQLFTSPANPPQ